MAKKKLITISLVVGIIVLAIITSYVLFFKVDEVDDIIDLDSVTRLTIVNGTNGNCTEVTDEQKKREILTSLRKLELTKRSEDDLVGWTFAVILGSNRKEVKLTFQGEDRCSRGVGKAYSVKNMDANLKSIMDSIINFKGEY